MHLVALNIIMWIRTLIKESIEEIIEFESEHRVSILLACRSPRCHHSRWIHSAIVKFQTGHHTVSKKGCKRKYNIFENAFLPERYLSPSLLCGVVKWGKPISCIARILHIAD